MNVWVSPAPPSYLCVGDTAIDTAARLALRRNSEQGTPNVGISYSYYPDAELKTVSAGFSSVSNSYDRLNRLTSSSLSSVRSFAVNHKYDGVNLTNSTVSAGGAQASATAYTYDAAERLDILTAKDRKGTQSFQYKYNPENGRIASVSNTGPGVSPII